MSTKKTVFAGFFVALGVLLPIAFHAFGPVARIISPMHIPVFMGGLILGPIYGLIVGVATPIISSLLTGMPPVMPMLPMMVAELGVYGLVSGLLSRKLNLWLAMLGAIVCGRAMIVVVLMLFGELLQIKADPFTYVWGGIMTGAPGIILQLLLIPFIVKRLKIAFSHHELFK
ncbi:hypothetical protein D081_2047 [Anaerovibrio sp. JC8]|uniref:ECF transporter S component n=1 Tax=Anaerovibrio sp. JC8 TaxID=1240085 RepID=UPI000A0C2B73|nr:ECF transporter S component [Anaerovibrio sp. JC8]ORT99318.1 hypothetical protein D081_2047 [Anaerovibrio sp. JC8]